VGGGKREPAGKNAGGKISQFSGIRGETETRGVTMHSRGGIKYDQGRMKRGEKQRDVGRNKGGKPGAEAQAS